ncbi:hypothetical protein [Pseudomonas viridiflava]|uniref:hypothetical protein n=1 Tax=Pseudomonas viridiflava TaxID=33069 RepID=UPI000F021060|nr:hypothetical protein [Pseudomonas viridiflava]QXG27185.1 hypothetical protein KTT56_10190 [Pseudomonas viridiflava]
MINDKVREQFEAWALSCNQMIDKANGVYLVRLVDCLWVAWRASREALVIDLPDAWHQDRQRLMDAGEVSEAVEAAGVRVQS